MPGSQRCLLRGFSLVIYEELSRKFNAAPVRCYGTATHYRPEREKRLTYFVGSYDVHLVRVGRSWKIDQFKFDAKYVE